MDYKYLYPIRLWPNYISDYSPIILPVLAESHMDRYTQLRSLWRCQETLHGRAKNSAAPVRCLGRPGARGLRRRML